MNKWKKAISAGMSAALVASLFTFIAAGTVSASVTVTSAGNVPQGGSSSGTAGFRITEEAIASLSNAAGSIDIHITDSASADTLGFSGTPVVSAPGSLGASASIAGGTLTFSWTHSDVLNIEYIDVSGLTIDDLGGAATGAIKATLQNPTGNASVAAFQAGGTASGVLATGVAISATSATVNVTTTGCTFVNTTTAGAGKFAFAAGAAGTTAESLDGTQAAGGPGQQVLTITTAGGFASVHNAGDVVTQTGACSPNGVLASPGTVVAALTYDKPTNATVFPGENNSPANNLVIHEPSAGFLAAASTFTYTIATDGVVFSTAPTVTSSNLSNEVQTVTIALEGAGDTFTLTFGANTTGPLAADTATAAAVQTALAALASIGSGNVTVTGADGGPYTVTFVGALAATNVAALTGTGTDGADADAIAPTVTVATTQVGGAGAMVLSAPVLSADRKSATVTVTTASTLAGATITLSNILYDVAATVPAGTFISVGITTSAGKAVLPPSRTNAVVFRGISASAPSPIVYIGENAQATGLISFTEAAAGFFTDGTGSNNTFQICPNGVLYSFTLAPYAKVVGGVAAGNLILRDGAGPSTTNIVKGTQNGSCYYWTVWTKSTTASTIQIGNSDLTSGPIINVTVAQAPGGVDVQLSIGSSALDTQLAATVQFATAMYRNQVSVTALSQPSIPAGANHAAAGNIQIAETGLGQLKALENICVEVLYRSFVNTDTFLNGLNTADLPVATASGTGLVIGPVNSSRQACPADENEPIVPPGYMQSFRFPVLQQSTAGDGKVVISNISYTTLADAVAGPVQVSVSGTGGEPTLVIFHSTVSNARIGAQLAGTAGTRLGVTQVGAFTTSTKVVALRHYVTYRFDFGVGAAGQHIDIWGATKVGNDWSAFAKVTTRVANASGVVYYYIRQNSATWKSYRAMWAGGGVFSPARQARWR